MKKFLILLLLAAVTAAVINFIGSRNKPYYKGLSDISSSKIGNSGYSLKGKLEFYNPSPFSVKLDELSIKLIQNGKNIIETTELIDHKIKSNSSAHHPFEFRLSRDEIDTTSNEFIIKGKVSSGGFNAFEINISDTFNIR